MRGLVLLVHRLTLEQRHNLHQHNRSFGQHPVTSAHRMTDVMGVRHPRHGIRRSQPLRKARPIQDASFATAPTACSSRFYLSILGRSNPPTAQYDGANIATDFDRGNRNTYYTDLAKKAALKVHGRPYSLL